MEEAAEEIANAGPGPVLVILYESWAQEAQQLLPGVVRIATACQAAGASIRAYTTDRHQTPLRHLADTLAAQQAPFPPVRMLSWSPGSLTAAMAPLGIRINRWWGTPLIAVRRHGQVLIQAEDDEVWAQTERIVAACRAR